MIVYGDAVRVEGRGREVEHARSEVDLALREAGSVETARRALIRLGELEQALFDAAPEGIRQDRVDAARAAARFATDGAAGAFERVSRAGPNHDPSAVRRAREALRRALRALSLVPPSEDPVRIHVPEGFAFYAVLPEQYRAAAHRWADEHATGPRGVLVAGVRSIGTTLSAVVAAALRARGFRVRRVTVRPAGHPFARRAEGRVPRAAHGIVVDEGPGLSGSSMLATADLLRRSGVDSVDLFPGHGSGPGAAASAGARRRWQSHRTYAADRETRGPEGRDLAGLLWNGIEALRGDEPVGCEDWGGGAWRARLYGEPSLWPAAPRALERPKLLVTGRSGRRVLFKFGGLATAPRGRGSMADALARRLAALAPGGWAAPPLGVALGFVAQEWVAGVPCSASGATAETLDHVAGYAAASARGPLPPRDAEEARARLLETVRVNVTEALGEDAARAALDIVDSSRPPPAAIPGAGDGRMAPHEWIRTSEDRVLKTDAGGHDLDHTWVGRQPLLWDTAGALLEWDLHGGAASRFLDALEARSGIRAREHLAGYLIAYTAHRLGQSRLFAEVEREPLERGIQERAFGRWRDTLLRFLSDREERRGMVA